MTNIAVNSRRGRISTAVLGPLGLVLALLAGCGSDQSTTAARASDSAAIERYYAEYPDFFHFRSLADLPDDLTWEDGSDLPEIGDPAARKGGTLRLPLQDFPRTLRHVGPDANGNFRRFLLDYTMISLAIVYPENDARHFPGLAQSWAVDSATSTVYVRLDPAATWSDGVPVTADDFFYMFYFYRSPHIVAPWYNNWYTNEYARITRYDTHTFSITLPQTKPDLADRVLRLYPIPRHHYLDLAADFVDRYQWEHMPTTGPYVIREADIRKGRSIALTRLDDWWGRDRKHFRYLFNPDSISFSVIRDTAKSFEAFKRGDIDMIPTDLTELWYDKLPDSDPEVARGFIHKSMFYNVHPRPPYGLWINTSRPLLDNRDIRIGISYASNWQLVIDSFFRGDASRLNTTNDGFGDFTHPNITARPFDITLAREHFRKAGFDESGPDGILVNASGQRLSVSLTTGYEHFRDVLTILKEEALKAGLELRVEVLDSTAGWKKMQEKKHDIAFVAFAGFLEMYPRYWEQHHSVNAYDQAFLADGSVNPARQVKAQTNNLESIAIAELDRLIERYDASPDRAEMVALAHQMEELMFDHGSFVPGFMFGYYRIGHWRWLRFPESFNVKHSRDHLGWFLFWVDEEAQRETRAAQRSGNTFPPRVQVFDQYRGL